MNLLERWIGAWNRIWRRKPGRYSAAYTTAAANTAPTVEQIREAITAMEHLRTQQKNSRIPDVILMTPNIAQRLREHCDQFPVAAPATMRGLDSLHGISTEVHASSGAMYLRALGLRDRGKRVMVVDEAGNVFEADPETSSNRSGFKHPSAPVSCCQYVSYDV